MQCGTKWKGFIQFLALRPLESQITPIRRITRIRLICVIRFIRVIRDTISHLLKSGIEFCGSIGQIIQFPVSNWKFTHVSIRVNARFL